jgi:hypothetical protein
MYLVECSRMLRLEIFLSDLVMLLTIRDGFETCALVSHMMHRIESRSPQQAKHTFQYIGRVQNTLNFHAIWFI